VGQKLSPYSSILTDAPNTGALTGRSAAIALQAVNDHIALAVVIPFPAACEFFQSITSLRNRVLQTKPSDPADLGERLAKFYFR